MSATRRDAAPVDDSPSAAPIGWTPTLFRRQVARGPLRIAVEGPSEALTYAGLDRLTDRRARALGALGVGPGTIVALALPRSVGAVAAMLAVMKAGGAFLPIDPDYPTARLAFLLKDSAAPVVITTPEIAPVLPVTGARVVLLDELDADADPGGRPLPGGDPGDLSYAIYTSGSTGRPKAALLTHRGIGPLAEAQASAFGIGSGTRVLQFAMLGFDAAISEIVVTLLAGGTVCVAEAGALVPGPALARTLLDRRIGVATLPPTVLSLLPEGNYPDLGVLVVAGEACPAALASRWSVGRRLLNAYGPAEATVCASIHACPEGPQSTPPIGLPLPFVEAVVVDDAGDPVPDGMPGELLLGGPGLAVGYLRRPDLTAERFVPHPTAADPSRRLYRTGDRVRRRDDGVLEFLGRLDDQVKIRGVRIEPAEVRDALESHDRVRASAVVAEGEGRDRRLAAFVVPREGRRPSVDALYDFLRDRLPIRMIPGRIVLVDRLPMTPNGKLDGRALIASSGPGPSGPSRPRPRRSPPRDALEFEVANAWREIFGVEVGIDDDFFALGGDSLSAMDLLARLHRRCGVALPVAALLDSPTVAGLAEALGERREPAGWSPLVPIQAKGDRPPLFCVHPGGGNVLCYVDLARALGPSRPLYGLQAPGVDPGRRPLASIEAMADAYLDAVEPARRGGPLLLCGWSFGGVVAFEMARRLAEAGRPVDGLILLDAGFVYAFAVLRALIPSERPLVRYLGADREAIFPEFRIHASRSRIVPPGASEGQVRRSFEVFMANVEALYAYRPGPYDAGPITLVTAEEPFADRRRGPVDEWRTICDELDVVTVPGNHLTMLRPPHVAALASALADRLDPRPSGPLGRERSLG